MNQRQFSVSSFLQPSDGEPIRSVVTESPDAAVVAWVVLPGQRISAHVHPEGQDTWTILSGGGQYQLDALGATVALQAGDIVVAHRGEVHGIHNGGSDPLVFVSVVSPAASGFQPL